MSMQDLLEQAAARPRSPLDLQAAWDVGRRRRRRRRVASAGAVTVGVLVLVMAVVAGPWGESVRIDPVDPAASAPTAKDSAPPVSSGAPMFASETGTTLLFDDGSTGLLAIELDTGRRSSVRLTGQGPGDQPFRIWKMGSWLVHGSGAIWASAPGTDQPARELGRATYFVPASAPDQLWFIEYPGGRIGEGVPTWTLVDASGSILHETVGELGWYALRGMHGGLAVRNVSGEVRIYDPEQEAVVQYLGGPEGALADVSNERVVWCYQLPCTRVGIRTSVHEILIEAGPDEYFDPTQMWLADGGAYLAAVVGTSSVKELRVYQVLDGHSPVLARLPIEDSHTVGDWNEMGEQFFFKQDATEYSDRGLLGRWSNSRPGTIELIGLPTGVTGLGTLVTYPSSTVEEVFGS